MLTNLSIDDLKKIGVYMVHNQNTGEAYFGSGILGDRKKVHERLLSTSSHWNRKLQKAYDRDQNFDFIGIPVNSDDKEEARQIALEIEQVDITENKDNPLLLNIAMNVEKPMTGFKHTPESIEKNRQAAMKRWQNPEHREKVIAAQNAGKANMSDATKAERSKKLSESNRVRYERDGAHVSKGRTMSAEFCANNSNKIAEKWKDPVYREKQLQSRVGKTNETARKQVKVGDVIYPSLTAAADAHGLTKQGARGRIMSERSSDWNYHSDGE